MNAKTDEGDSSIMSPYHPATSSIQDTAEEVSLKISYRYARACATHHVHILEINGDSFRLRQSRRAKT